MSPQDLWKKLKAAVHLDAASKIKSPIKNLIILFSIGVALMLISHFFNGGATAKSPPKTLTTGTTTTSSKGDSSQPASLLKNSTDNPQTLADYESYYEEQLTSILNSMAGISNAKVLVTLESGPEQVYQQDIKTSDQRTTERDANGGTRSIVNQSNDSSLVIVDQGNGQKGPLLVTQKGPTFKAILVVANGVDRPSAVERVKTAVSTVLDVPSYKVSVQERN